MPPQVELEEYAEREREDLANREMQLRELKSAEEAKAAEAARAAAKAASQARKAEEQVCSRPWVVDLLATLPIRHLPVLCTTRCPLPRGTHRPNLRPRLTQSAGRHGSRMG